MGAPVQVASEAPFTAVLTIDPGEVIDGSPARGFAESDVILSTANRAPGSGRVDLRWGADPLATGINAARFLDEFWAGEAGLAHADALEFGRALLARVLGHPRLRERWAKIQAWRGARPLRLELILPPAASSLINAIPFELLAEQTFLFYAGGATLVRCVRDLEPRRAEIRRGDRLVVAWANPTNVSGRFDDAVFERHEAELAAAGGTAHLQVQPPVARAGLAQLQDALADHGPVPVLSLVAHGYPTGGRLAFENADRTSQPVAASDIAAAARASGTQVALLWSCHAARHHADLGSLAERLLDPAGGNLAAVVAAHGALRADWTARAARRLLHALTAVDGNDLEHAVAAARQTLGEQTPHWAALAYYARPADGRTVTYDDAGAAAVAALSAAAVAVARAPVTRGGFDPVGPIRSPDGGILIARGGVDLDLPLPPVAVTGVPSPFPGPPPQDPGLPSPDPGRPTRGSGQDVEVTGLPAAPYYWVDRPAEVGAVGALLAAHRVVTVCGMPGIGKTEVARAAAQRAIAAAAVDAALWIALDELGSVDDLRARIAAWAGVADPDAPDARLARAIGARRALWILDNAEDLVRDHGPELRRLLTALVDPCPGLRLLVTSQRPLGDLHGEREHRCLVRRIEAPATCRALFARAAGSPLDARAPAEALAAILDLLDGHPRSLVLVASQVRDGGANLPRLRARLVERTDEAVLAVDLLAGGVDWDAHDRLRAERLVSSLHLAYRPLRDHAPGAAELFAWLGTLPAGLPVALAPAIFGPATPDHVATLLRVSLVELRGDDERLELPAPIRWYAARKLAEDVAPARQADLLVRTFEALASLMEAAYQRLGKPGRGAVIEASRREAANLDALLDRVGQSPTETSALAPLVARAFAVWGSIRIDGGHVAHAARLVERARAATVAAPLRGLDHANLAKATGDLHRVAEQHADAEAAYRDALDMYAALDVPLGEARAQVGLGRLYLRTSRPAEAEAAVDRALATLTAGDWPGDEARALSSLGHLYVRTARLADAEAAHTRALGRLAGLDAAQDTAATHLALGDVYVRTDRLAEAEAAYAQARDGFAAIDAHREQAIAEHALAGLRHRDDRHAEAEAAYRGALATFVAAGDRASEADTRRALGALLSDTDRPAEAEAAFTQALDAFTAIREPLGEANTGYQLGNHHLRAGRLAEAEAAYRRALDAFITIREPLGEANARSALGRVFALTERLADSEASYHRALDIYAEIGDRRGEANTCESLGALLRDLARLAEADVTYRRALAIFAAIGDRHSEARATSLLGGLAVMRGHASDGYDRHRAARARYLAIDDRLGAARELGYMALIARLVHSMDRALVLAGQARTELHASGRPPAAALMGGELVDIAALADRADVFIPALLLTWQAARGGSDSLGRKLAAYASAVLSPEALAAGLAPDEITELERQLAAAVGDAAARLEAAGEDPFGPLPPTPEPP